MKARELICLIVRAGGVRVRGSGDHEVYRLPCGRKLSVPQGGGRTEVSEQVLAKARRMLGRDIGR